MLSEWSWGQRALWLPINDAQDLQTHTDRSLVSNTDLVRQFALLFSLSPVAHSFFC